MSHYDFMVYGVRAWVQLFNAKLGLGHENCIDTNAQDMYTLV
jgi:hypothetical protein